ncbi:MAG: hypothetical protein HFJ54_01205 [Clostridia bacterium]|nr:hypothetical protein [Clostridia bacterium]
MIKLKFKVFWTILAIMLTAILLCGNIYGIESRVAGDGIENQISNETIPTSDEGINPISDDVPDDSIISQDEIYSGDLYILYGEDYTTTSYVMDKLVDGNVFIFGKDVTITGQVNGSVFVFAQNLTIEENASIGVHLFAFANNITMKGFTSDMYALCDKFNLTDKAVIYRDLKLAADESYLIGSVGRDIHVAGEKIEVYEDEERGLYVGGNLNYTSKTQIEDLDKIEIGGESIFKKSKEIEPSDTSKILNYIYRALENSIFALVIYACFIFLAPKFVGKLKDYASVRGLLTLPIGLGFVVLVPIISFLLMLTTVGLSMSFLLIMIYFIVLMINSSIVTIAINEFVADKFYIANSTWKKILMIIPVSLIVFLVRQIPVLGGWITALILFAGTGIAVLYQFDKRSKNK